MVADDTTIVNAGTYGENITTTRNGTAGNRITFLASGVVNTTQFKIYRSYITMDGFTINHGKFDIQNGDYNDILNNHISYGDIQMHYKNNANSPIGWLIKGNILSGAYSPAGDWPQIEIFGSYHIIENNEIGPARDVDAFRLWGHNNIIRNNYIHDLTHSPSSYAHMDGFQIFGDNGWESYNQIIENNSLINYQG